MPPIGSNTLFYGDNLPILREHVDDDSVDLVYLDPPFNSQASYNVLFKDQHGARSAAQLQAFKDTWTWPEAALTYAELTLDPGPVGHALRALGSLLKQGGMLAYLTMMAPRLWELRRVLKPTGSLYLHCDPTASHYLKILLDTIFGPENFRNEIVWKRTSAHNDPKRFGRIHDVLLYYAKDAGQVIYHPIYRDYDPAYIQSEFRQDENGRWYKAEDLTAPWHGGEGGRFEFHGRKPGPTRMWRLSYDEMERLWQEGLIKTDAAGIPLLRGHIMFLDEKLGVPAQDWWDDVLRIGNTAHERLGYPTQKPQALLERILLASSNPGDLILDPFCGCGTAIAAAQQLGRRWIGIDITQAAIQTIKQRIATSFGPDLPYQIVGEPVSLADAEALAAADKYQFQWWALGLVGARPDEKKKGADQGIDGSLYFRPDPAAPAQRIILSVKAGATGVAHIHELRGVIEREHAPIGVLITLQPPTGPMKADAAKAGFYTSPWGNHPRLQILTIADLLSGKQIDYPRTAGVNVTYKQAPRAKPGGPTQPNLLP